MELNSKFFSPESLRYQRPGECLRIPQAKLSQRTVAVMCECPNKTGQTFWQTQWGLGFGGGVTTPSLSAEFVDSLCGPHDVDRKWVCQPVLLEVDGELSKMLSTNDKNKLLADLINPPSITHPTTSRKAIWTNKTQTQKLTTSQQCASRT